MDGELGTTILVIVSKGGLVLIVSFFKRPLSYSSVGLSLASISVGDLTHVHHTYCCTFAWKWTVGFVPLWTVTPGWNGVVLAIFQDFAVVF